MFCTHCGAKLPDNSRFCGMCGNPTSAPATAPAEPVAEVPVAPVVEEIPEVKPEAVRCPQCGATFEKLPAFCGYCGAKLK